MSTTVQHTDYPALLRDTPLILSDTERQRIERLAAYKQALRPQLIIDAILERISCLRVAFDTANAFDSYQNLVLAIPVEYHNEDQREFYKDLALTLSKNSGIKNSFVQEHDGEPPKIIIELHNIFDAKKNFKEKTQENNNDTPVIMVGYQGPEYLKEYRDIISADFLIQARDNYYENALKPFKNPDTLLRALEHAATNNLRYLIVKLDGVVSSQSEDFQEIKRLLEVKEWVGQVALTDHHEAMNPQSRNRKSFDKFCKSVFNRSTYDMGYLGNEDRYRQAPRIYTARGNYNANDYHGNAVYISLNTKGQIEGNRQVQIRREEDEKRRAQEKLESPYAYRLETFQDQISRTKKSKTRAETKLSDLINDAELEVDILLRSFSFKWKRFWNKEITRDTQKSELVKKYERAPNIVQLKAERDRLTRSIEQIQQDIIEAQRKLSIAQRGEDPEAEVLIIAEPTAPVLEGDVISPDNSFEETAVVFPGVILEADFTDVTSQEDKVPQGHTNYDDYVALQFTLNNIQTLASHIEYFDVDITAFTKGVTDVCYLIERAADENGSVLNRSYLTQSRINLETLQQKMQTYVTHPRERTENTLSALQDYFATSIETLIATVTDEERARHDSAQSFRASIDVANEVAKGLFHLRPGT